MDWSHCDEIESDCRFEDSSIIQTDNPNYFNIDNGIDLRTENRVCGVFPFNKSKPSSSRSETKRGSLMNLWRSRSNSNSLNNNRKDSKASTTSRNASTTPTNAFSFRNRLEAFDETQNNTDDDVFFPKTSDQKFYTLSYNSVSTMEGHVRRHSVGTFSGRDKICTTSFIDEAPSEIAPKAPTNLRTNSRDQPLMTAAMCANIDDILIVTSKQSELGILWVTYLKSCFDKITKQRGRMSFNFVHVKIDDDKLDSDLIQRCQTTKLQIVIICPILLGLEHMFVKKKLTHIIKPDRTIGLLLDVKEIQLMDIHREFLPSFNKWKKCVVRDQDQSFVSSLLGIAQDILGRALRQRPLLSEAASFVHGSTHKAGPSSTFVAGKNHDNFTVIPKKMRLGQNKATVMMTEPFLQDDYIKIKIEKIGSVIEIPNIKRRNPYTLHFNVPECCMEVSMMIGVRVFKNNTDLGVRPIKCESRLKELEQILKNADAPMEFMCQSLGIPLSDTEKLDAHMAQSFQKNIPPNFDLLSSQSESSNCFKLLHKDGIHPEEYPTLMHFAARWGLEQLGLILLECPGAEVACEMKNSFGKTPTDIAEYHGYTKLSSSFKNFSKMNEFTSMYQYFKEFSNANLESGAMETRNEQHHTEGQVNGAYPTHYLEMKSSNDSDGNNNEIIAHEKSDATADITYLNVENNVSDIEPSDTVDAGPCFETQPIAKRDSCDLINNLNDMQIKGEDEKEITNELKITEEYYYESNAFNKTSQGNDFINRFDERQSESQLGSDYTSPKISVPSISGENSNFRNNDYLVQPSNRPVTNAFGDYLTQPSNRPILKESHNYINEASPYGNLKSKREASHLRLYFKKKSDSICEDGPGYSKIPEIVSPTKSSHSGTLKRADSDVSKKSVDDELVEIINDFKNNVFTIQEVEELVNSWKNRNDVQKSFKDKHEQMQRMREDYERIQQKIKENLKRPSPFERMRRIFSKKQKESPMVLPINLTGDPKFSLSNGDRPKSTLSLASSNSSGRISTTSSLGDSGTHSDHEERRNQQSYRVGQPGSLVFDNYSVPRPISTPTSTPIEDKRSVISSQNTPEIEHYILFPSNVPIFPSPPPCSMSTFKKTFN